MNSQERAFHAFAEFVAKLKGDEKSEAQLYLIHLLDAFGHDGMNLPEGTTFEYRVRFPGDRTKFADFVWPGRVLIEMKSRGEKLSVHYQQTFDYWLNLVPHRPPYVVLCNFDELWIYDFNTQLQEPVDRVKVSDLVARHSALNFLFPRQFQPIFGNNWVEVTRQAARDVAKAFNSMVHRGEPRDRARRFILQCVVAMFSEDIGLLPESLFTGLLEECRRAENLRGASYDLLGQLLRQMNDTNPARGGRFAGVRYFNGGLFSKVEPVELTPEELGLLLDAAKEDWSRVQPVIFGTLFEGSLDKDERHALGAHFTYEADIQKIVRPTIVRPWEERIADAKTAKALRDLLAELRAFRVLDPACGSGNFLFVAFRALCELEEKILLRLFGEYHTQVSVVGTASRISPKQFYGLDINENAVETAKVTLMLARRLATREAETFWVEHADVLPEHDAHALKFEDDLPLDNLDSNIKCADALFTPWPECDTIIGNPPFQSKNKMQQEFEPGYVRRVRDAYPAIPGRADFCVYWLRRTHDHLKPGQRAGLVGTNTIRQNYSREGGLDYIVQNGGAIVNAVSSQPWSGEAAVHVSIVNWIKGDGVGPRVLQLLTGTDREGPWERKTVDHINSALSFTIDVTQAKRLRTNADSGACYQGQTHGHEGFLLSLQEAAQMRKDKRAAAVIHPYLTADEMIANVGCQPSRYSIDLNHCEDITEASSYGKASERIKLLVFPAMQKNATEEKAETGRTVGPRQNHFKKWWKFWRGRGDCIDRISKISRYIACGQVTKRPIFEFISATIRPNAALIAFPLPDDYSFGILQSGIHWAWFTAKCSTLTERFRYTSDTVFDTFPWPQSPTLAHIHAVVEAGRALRLFRHHFMEEKHWTLRDMYRTLETPGANKLRDVHDELDQAVRAAYGMKSDDDILAFLLKLNLELADKEQNGEPITPPGLPTNIEKPQEFVSDDCVKVSEYGQALK